MTWNYLVSGLLVGASVITFDGNPNHPDSLAIWRLIEHSRATSVMISATWIMNCRKAGIHPEALDLACLRNIASVGSPLPAEGFEWINNRFDGRVILGSTSGGTDVCTAFVGSCPLVPVYAGEIACRFLGAKVESLDPEGRPLIGELGELVVTRPMPSMPVGFWGDDDGSRYSAAYFEFYPGVWRHGDWILITERGSCIITGRSDATLNRGGVRLGTGEFYSAVEELDDIADSLVVHLEDAEGGAGELILFVVMAPGLEFGDDVKSRIATALKSSLSPRHVPDNIYPVTSVPRTLTGKKLEVPVKSILRGKHADAVASRDALADPDALQQYELLAVRRGQETAHIAKQADSVPIEAGAQ
jgi:acetoacetyl-CoA synthetase